MKILRNVLAVVVGLIAGGAVNMALVIASPLVIPPPAGVDVSDPQSLSESMHLFEPKHFVFPFLAHALGTLVGALVAYLVAASHKPVFAYVIGACFLAGGIAAARRDPRAGVVRRPRSRDGIRPDGVSRNPARPQDDEAETLSESR